MAYARRALRIRPMIAAALSPLPATSPMTAHNIARRKDEDVIPVAADIARARNVPCRHRDALDRRQPGRQQASLECRRRRAIKLRGQRLDRQRCPVRRQLQQVDVLGS